VRLTVYDYFIRAMRQPATALSGCTGEALKSADGAAVVFSADAIDGHIAVVGYKCTSCVTLVALCEHLSDLIRGRAPDEAIQVAAGDLLALHSEIPLERRDRAAIAVDAMRSAVSRLIGMEKR
jgi:hypothetical protein